MSVYREPNYRILREADHPLPDGALLLEMRQPIDDDPTQPPKPAYIARGWWDDADFPYFDTLLLYVDQATCDADWQELVSDPDVSFADLHWIEKVASNVGDYIVSDATGFRQDGTQVQYTYSAEESSQFTDAASAPVGSFCEGRLFRARVCLPVEMIEEYEPLMDRMAFFEAPSADQSALIIEALIAAAWCLDTKGWVAEGQIYGIQPVANIRSRSYIPGPASDLQIFEDGLGGDINQAIGPERIRYARARDVDLFVSPPVANRLHDALDAIEDLFAEQAKQGGFYRRG